MKRKLCLLSLIFWVFHPELCFAKKPWPMFKDVKAKVAIQELSKGVRYSYALKNPTKNTLSIYVFQVDLRTVENGPSIGLCELPPNVSGQEFDRSIKEAKRVDTVATSTPNHSWEVEYPGLWGSGDLNTASMINPGEMLGGFVIVSDLPTGVKEFVVNGYDFDFIENPEAFEFKGSLQELYFAACYAKRVVGVTIAPVAPPEPFTASSWTIRMTGYAVEARKQKWIKTDKVLAEIKRLISGLNTGDVGKLKAAVKKAEAYVLAEKKKGSLTDEADALVRLNAQYLLKRIGGPDGKSSAGTR